MRARSGRMICALVGALLLCSSLTGRVHAQDAAEPAQASTLLVRTEPGTPPKSIVRSKSIEGLGPDAQLTGGIGFGFEAKLQNFFLARARLGLLYAAEPWIANLGFTAEVGALAGLGWGGELELSRAGTLFGTAGVSRVDESRWLAHLGIGFTIFGLEWQHVWNGGKPHNALLLEVRLPLGLWWLHKRQEKVEAESAGAARQPRAPHIIQRPTLTPKTPPSASDEAPAALTSDSAGPPAAAPTTAGAAGSGAVASPATAAVAESDAAENGRLAAPGGGAAPTPGGSASPGAAGSRTAPDVTALEIEFAARMADAQSARGRGDHLAEAIALSRAYTLRPEPGVALQLSAAELALGKPRSALSDWQRAGDLQKLSAEDRARAAELRQQISANLAQLRLSLSGGLSEQDVVSIDGVVEPTANRGYDVPLDPGDHSLQVKRAGRVLLEQTFHAQPGKLLRLELALALPHD